MFQQRLSNTYAHACHGHNRGAGHLRPLVALSLHLLLPGGALGAFSGRGMAGHAAIFGGEAAQTAFEGFLGIWRASYKENDGSVPELHASVLPKAFQGVTSKIVISSGGAAGGVVTEGMGYAIMVEGYQAVRDDTGAHAQHKALANAIPLIKGWLGMVNGPKEIWGKEAEHPLGGGSGERESATEVDTAPYGVSAIVGKRGAAPGASGVAAWKYPTSQCAPFCHGSATDGDEDAVLGMIYVAHALGHQKDFVDMVMRAVISFASADLGFPDLYRTLPDGTKLFVPKGGSDWGGLLPGGGKYKTSQQPWCYNPSYFAPGHYRLFRDFVSKHWESDFDQYMPRHLDGSKSTKKELMEAFDGTITAGYNILYHSSCSSGAVANWVGVKAECDADDDISCKGVPWATTPYVGEDGECTASGTTFGSYGPDASRTPWRIAMDYILYTQESTYVPMYDRSGKRGHHIVFNAQVYLNRFAQQYITQSKCDGAKGKCQAYELAPAFSMNAKGLTCDEVPNAGQDWWAAFMSYPTFTAFVAPIDGLSREESTGWMETFANICSWSGGKPTGQLCTSSYFELGQEVISTMIIAGAVAPLGRKAHHKGVVVGRRPNHPVTGYAHPKIKTQFEDGTAAKRPFARAPDAKHPKVKYMFKDATAASAERHPKAKTMFRDGTQPRNGSPTGYKQKTHFTDGHSDDDDADTLEEERGFCCFDPVGGDNCQCNIHARSQKDSHCGKSRSNCRSCVGADQWCSAKGFGDVIMEDAPAEPGKEVANDAADQHGFYATIGLGVLTASGLVALASAAVRRFYGRLSYARMASTRQVDEGC